MYASQELVQPLYRARGGREERHSSSFDDWAIDWMVMKENALSASSLDIDPDRADHIYGAEPESD